MTRLIWAGLLCAAWLSGCASDPGGLLLSLRELRALELALNGDTWPYSSRCPWFQALQSAQLKLWAEIDRRRIELDRALKNRLPF